MEEKPQNEYQESIVEQPISSEQKLQIEEAPRLEKEKVLDSDKEKKLEAKPIEKEQKTEKTIKKKTTPASNIPSGKIQQQIKHLMGLDKKNQIKALCDLSSQKGVGFAIEAAKNLNNAYVLDEFHDALIDIDELRKKLIERGDL